jgi:hypothetical protein
VTALLAAATGALLGFAAAFLLAALGFRIIRTARRRAAR